MSVTEATCRWSFKALPGYFFDYSNVFESNADFRASTLPMLGLTDRVYDDATSSNDIGEPWPRFAAHVNYLNQHAPPSTRYKVLYITRHGIGFHNVFEAQVGREAWNTKWSHLDGHGDITWADSHLNEEGMKQANILSQIWSTTVQDYGMPAPETIYTSPLARCLETTRLMLANTMGLRELPFQPIIKEDLRERITDHTCDRRSPRSWIEERYPDYVFENGFAEEDVSWSGKHWETEEEHLNRKQRMLEEIFDNDPKTFISLTTHSYAMSAILAAVHMPRFRLREGSSVALLVKGERL